MFTLPTVVNLSLAPSKLNYNVYLYPLEQLILPGTLHTVIDTCVSPSKPNYQFITYPPD